MIRFTRNLERIRKQQRLSQEQAAALCGMPMQQFQRIAAGQANLQFSTLTRLVEGLGIDVVDLFAPLKKNR